MRAIDKIIIHCSATRPGWMADAGLAAQVEEIRRWHVDERGWSDIGYHLLIGRDGRFAGGRPMARTGAHVRGHNKGSIGVCLIGGHGAAADDRFEEHFTPFQYVALRNVCADLPPTFESVSIHGHNEFSAKGCPGFRVAEWAAEVGLA
ncbi:MAG: N-acetylmuramoyl-L-alanine amidase [Pseudomonadota bacterium]